ncbi:MAG: class I SAM-dependent methyltransferase [Patescibacteria group bacterium]
MNFPKLFLNHNKKERFKNFFRQFENIFFFSRLEKELANSKSVLDVGCGNDSSLGRLAKTFSSEGIDIYPRCIEISKRNHYHDTYKLGDVRKLGKYYKNKSFDTLISIDVIEHLTKQEALKMISQMEKIARKKVILMTPQGYIDQKAYDGNPYQVHHSGWSKKDLQDMGYQVYGLRGLKYLRNDEASIRFSPWIFWGLFSAVTEILLFFFPDLSFQLFAVKSLEHDSPKNKTHE